MLGIMIHSFILHDKSFRTFIEEVIEVISIRQGEDLMSFGTRKSKFEQRWLSQSLYH